MRNKASGERYKFLGLFVCDTNKVAGEIVFRKGDVICPYMGELISEATLETRYPANTLAPYTFRANKKKIVDAACLRGVGAIANACTQKNTHCKQNAGIRDSSAQYYPLVKAMKTIRNGEEIFVSYGPTYFSKTSVHKIHKTTPSSTYTTDKPICRHRYKKRSYKRKPA